jgi:hypothetical protein
MIYLNSSPFLLHYINLTSLQEMVVLLQAENMFIVPIFWHNEAKFETIISFESDRCYKVT